MKQSESHFETESHLEAQNQFEKELSLHYRRSKSATKAPFEIKQNVLLKAIRADKEKQLSFSWQGFAQLGFAASVLVLGFILLMPESPAPFNPMASQNIIEFHTLENKPDATSTSARATINIAYAKLERDYARNTLLIAAVQKQARLKINGDGSWQLNTCEQHNLLLSGELVAMLDKYQLLPDLPQSGMMVNVGFDNEGHIIQIEASQSSMLC